MTRRSFALCCAATLLSLANALVLPPAATSPLRGPKLSRARHSPPRLAAKPRPGSRPARGGGGGGGGFGASPAGGSKPKAASGGGGFGASPAGGSKPKVAATGAKSEAADLRAAAKAYARLNAESCLATDVYVRATADAVSSSSSVSSSGSSSGSSSSGGDSWFTQWG